jgi:hypothetical protein
LRSTSSPTSCIGRTQRSAAAIRSLTRTRGGVVFLFVVGSVSFGLLVFLGGWIVATFVLNETWLPSVHAIGLAVAFARLSFYVSVGWAGIRLVGHGFKVHWVAAPRGGWRSQLEWALVLAFVAVTGTELILHLLPSSRKRDLTNSPLCLHGRSTPHA